MSHSKQISTPRAMEMFPLSPLHTPSSSTAAATHCFPFYPVGSQPFLVTLRPLLQTPLQEKLQWTLHFSVQRKQGMLVIELTSKPFPASM